MFSVCPCVSRLPPVSFYRYLRAARHAEECRCAATDAVRLALRHCRLAPSPLPPPRLGAVAISVTTTALDGVCGAVCGDARVPGFGCGLARFGCGLAHESVGGLVLRGFGLCGSCVCPVCVPAPPGVFLPVTCVSIQLTLSQICVDSTDPFSTNFTADSFRGAMVFLIAINAAQRLAKDHQIDLDALSRRLAGRRNQSYIARSDVMHAVVDQMTHHNLRNELKSRRMKILLLEATKKF